MTSSVFPGAIDSFPADLHDWHADHTHIDDAVIAMQTSLRPLAATQVTVVTDGVTDNVATLQAAMNALTLGGTVRIATPTTGNKIALSTDLLIPKNVTLEFDTSTTKLASDESNGLVFVPTAGATPTILVTDSGGATMAAVGGSSLNWLITRNSGSFSANFTPGQIITIVGTGGAAVTTNCQIVNNGGTTLTVTGGAGMVAGSGITTINAFWGGLVVTLGDYSGVRRVSADAGTQFPRAIVYGMGLRNRLEFPDAHGGTLCALDGVMSVGGSTQPTLLHPQSDNSANQNTAFARQYGPYSARFQTNDVEINGGRLVRGTKSFVANGNSIAVQAQLVHFTDATNGGPNVECGTTGVFTNCEIDGANGTNGTALLEHLSNAQTGGGTDAGNSEWIGLQIIPDALQIPVLLENSTRSSVTIHKLDILGNSALQPNAIAQFVNGNNLATDIDGVKFSTNGMANAAALTTTTSGSNNVNVNTFAGSGVLNCVSTTSFPTAGTLFVELQGGGTATISYTNTTSTTFTGCTTLLSGAGLLFTRGAIDLITLVTAGSNGVTANTFTQVAPGTLNVGSTTNFPTSGQILVATSGNNAALLSYTGMTGTTFTGCVFISGGGNFQTNSQVNLLVLWSGGFPGRARNIAYNNGSVTQTLLPDAPIPFYAYPANPATTTSLTLVMAGLGILYTPTMYPNLIIDVWGEAGNATAAAGTNVALRYSSGAAPANGAAVTGTAPPAGTFGPIHASSAANQTPFAISSGRITSFVPVGTQIWVDLAYDTTNASDAAGLANLIFRIVETP